MGVSDPFVSDSEIDYGKHSKDICEESNGRIPKTKFLFYVMLKAISKNNKIIAFSIFLHNFLPH